MHHIHANHGVTTNMKKMVQSALIAMIASLGMLAACSSESSDGESLVNVPENLSARKGESFDFKYLSSCKNNLAKWAEGIGEENIDFFINEDGSATVNMETGILCNGFVSMIYETRNDTLFAEQNYTYIRKEWDPVKEDSVIVEMGETRTHCSCLVDIELRIPPEFVGTKYVDFEGDFYTINYKKK
jgi:hypothetical protein